MKRERIHKFSEYVKEGISDYLNSIPSNRPPGANPPWNLGGTDPSSTFGQTQQGKIVLGSSTDSGSIKQGATLVSKGDQVKNLQSFLIALGFLHVSYKGSDGQVHPSNDGIFGPKTKAAVITYQQKNGLTPDGLAGKSTMTKLLGTVKPAEPQIQQKIQNSAQKNPTFADRLHQFGGEVTSAVSSVGSSIGTFWDNYNPLQLLKTIGHDVIMKLPLHLRGFFEYLIGRTEPFTEQNMTPDELSQLKQYAEQRVGKGFDYPYWKSLTKEIVPTSLTSAGQQKEMATIGAPGAQQASLLNPADSTKFCYFFGGVDPSNITKNGNQLEVKDHYDMNYWESKEPGNKEKLMKNIASSLSNFLHGEATAYSVIRSMAATRETTGYRGFPVDIKITDTTPSVQKVTDPALGLSIPTVGQS